MNNKKKIEKDLSYIYSQIESICEYNSLKVLKAFNECKVNETHFNTTTGYGYNDIGRDKVEEVFANIFKSEDALVRQNIISGTHALTISLFGLLRPNDTLLSITGAPYDTLQEVIGIRPNDSSLISYGINYEQIDLIKNEFDYESISERLNKSFIKVIHIQRSKGYSIRKTISLDKLKNIIDFIKDKSPKTIILIDNCYCEFVNKIEPIELGADIVVGSLIKNLGGTIASNGGYVVGSKNNIKLISERLTVPGCGKEIGPSQNANRSLLQGISFAPRVVSEALKTVVFASKELSDLGYFVEPLYDEERSDIVQTIIFNDENKLINFCKGIQESSLIDSDAVCIPTDMPGYNDKIIMASGSFTQGSSIELSCDGPLRSPYACYLQGSQNYYYGKHAIINAINKIK